MAVSVAAVMRQVRNFFERKSETKDGRFTIADSALSPAPAAPWIAISGSRYNDGVYRVIGNGGLDSVTDETFDGRVWMLYPPKDFLALCEEISAYDDKNPPGAYQSESFGGYSYTRSAGSGGGVATWQQAYKDRLVPYQRMFTGVSI